MEPIVYGHELRGIHLLPELQHLHYLRIAPSLERPSDQILCLIMHIMHMVQGAQGRINVRRGEYGDEVRRDCAEGGTAFVLKPG